MRCFENYKNTTFFFNAKKHRPHLRSSVRITKKYRFGQKTQKIFAQFEKLKKN